MIGFKSREWHHCCDLLRYGDIIHDFNAETEQGWRRELFIELRNCGKRERWRIVMLGGDFIECEKIK